MKDHLGSTRAVTDQHNSILATFDYYPFGLLMLDRYTIANNTTEKFTGKELDKNLNLYYFGARYLDPAIGRWLVVDPLRQYASPYVYVGNNPITFIDPTGLLGDYYDEEGNYLGSDLIDDNKVYVVEDASNFNISDFRKGGKFFNNLFAFKGDVNYIGQVSEVFVTGDPASDRRIQNLHPAIRMKATNFINQANQLSGNTLIRVSQGLRTFAEQSALYAQGRTIPGDIVTNANAGFSSHNFGLAFDIAGITNGKIDYNLNWGRLSKLGKSYGFEWGGSWQSFPDRPHFQNLFGHSIKSLRELYQARKLWNNYVKLK